MAIHPEGRIVDPKARWKATEDLFGYIQASDCLEANKTLLSRFIMDARLGKTILKGAKKKVGMARQVKYFQDLKKLDRYFKKPLDQVMQQEMEKFITDLEDGRLVRTNGQAYKPETQVCMKKIIIKFYKWLNGGKTLPDLVSWIDTSCQIKYYRAINEQQLQTILHRLHGTTYQNIVRNRAILSFLFDTGVRADECLNVRLQHVKKDNGNYMIQVEFSKTKARTVSAPICAKYLDEWISIHPNKDEPLAQLFPLTYQALCNVVKRAGKLINERLTPHGLRHSSATYYAKKLPRYPFCKRYGWAMSSRQPDRYIDQEGLGEDATIQAVKQDSIQKVADENEELRREMALLKEQMNRVLQADRAEVRKLIALCLEQQTDG